MKRCRTTFAAAALGLAMTTQALAQGTPIEVFKTNGCGCCLAWMEHLEENGFAPTGEDLFGGALIRYKIDSGIPPKMISCHTAKIDGYTIEGHVPAADIRRLLEERPDAVGLAMAEMPLGSPGMDFGERREAYEVSLIRQDGSAEVFASYPAN